MTTPLRRLALVLSALLLAACGGAGTPAAAPVADAAATPRPPTGGDQAPLTNLTDGCVDEPVEGVDYFPDKAVFTEANSVEVEYHPTHKIVTVTPPAEGATPLRYALVQCGTDAPDVDADVQVVEVPVQQIATLTTTNLPHLDLLGGVDRLVGVGTAAYVSTPSVLDHIAANSVNDYADEMGTPDLERLVALSPDLLIMDGFGDAVLDEVNRLHDAGVPTAVNADFNETTLLGRAEWIKFTALFLNEEAAAETVFSEIASTYRDTAETASRAEAKPTVFANMPFEGTWFMPGGQSFFAAAVADAGGDYVFADDSSRGSIQLDFETVLERAGDADVWLQAGAAEGTLDDLLAQDPRFSEFEAFSKGQVWAADVGVTPTGGHPYYELAYTRADLLLSDLVHILHPQLLPEHELVFFAQVPPAS